jgi:prophage endopeptidase
MTPKAWLIIGAELLLSLLLIYILLGQISSEKKGRRCHIAG